MNTVKTKAGTILPLRDMKGKDYLDVQYRVLWMREEHPDWGITTEFLRLDSEVAIAKATILDSAGKILAQGTKTETPGGFADFIEKAETGAVGRALALCGYGTQFAQELEEGERIVDSPREPKTAPQALQASGPVDLDSYVLTFGKFKGQALGAVGAAEIRNYYEFLKRNEKPGQAASEGFLKMAAFIATRTPKSN